MTDRAALLDYADHLLDGTLPLGSRSTRVAAVMARSAFEDWLDEQCQWAVTAVIRPSTDRKSTRLNSSHIEPSRMPSSA